MATHDTFDLLAERISIHLNDTHPVLAVPELMRLLIDEHRLSFPAAWGHVQKIFSYTNHTLMSEALETWPVETLARILPRHLQIILELNAQFLTDVTQRHGTDIELMRRVSLIDENGERRVRMAYLAVIASHSVNGVSALHSALMQQSIFADFAQLFPERFNNKTNGITQRRWLALANPSLVCAARRAHRARLAARSDAAGAHRPLGRRARIPAAFSRRQAGRTNNAWPTGSRPRSASRSIRPRCSTCRSSACTNTSGNC